MKMIRWARIQWDRVLAAVCTGVGALFVIIGWVRIGEEVLTAQQIPYVMSGGIGGLFLLGCGAVLWLSADLRDEWRVLDAIRREQHPLPPPGSIESNGEIADPPRQRPLEAPRL